MRHDMTTRGDGMSRCGRSRVEVTAMPVRHRNWPCRRCFPLVTGEVVELPPPPVECQGGCGVVVPGGLGWCGHCWELHQALQENGATSTADLLAAGPGRAHNAMWRIKDLVRRTGVADAEELVTELERVVRAGVEQ